MNTTPLTLRHFLFFCFCLSSSVGLCQPQEPDSEELERRNGFKNIYLHSSVDSLKGAVFKDDYTEKGGFPAKVYEVKGEEYKTIGEIRIKEITLKTYKSLIYEIVVITEKDPNLMIGMSKALGKPSFSLRTNLYSWRSKSLVLFFEPSGKKDLKLTYRSYPVLKLMAEDKGKKTDDIKSDF